MYCGVDCEVQTRLGESVSLCSSSQLLPIHSAPAQESPAIMVTDLYPPLSESNMHMFPSRTDFGTEKCVGIDALTPLEVIDGILGESVSLYSPPASYSPCPSPRNL